MNLIDFIFQINVTKYIINHKGIYHVTHFILSKLLIISNCIFVPIRLSMC